MTWGEGVLPGFGWCVLVMVGMCRGFGEGTGKFVFGCALLYCLLVFTVFNTIIRVCWIVVGFAIVGIRI